MEIRSPVKILTPVLAIACTVLAISSVYLLSEVRAERARASTEADARASWEKRARDLMSRDGARLPLASAGPGRVEDTGVPGSTAAAPNEPPAAASNAGESSRRLERIPPTRFNPSNTPQGRELLRVQARTGAKRAYGELIKKLNLTAEQAETLMKLLVDQQERERDAFERLGERRDLSAINQLRNELLSQSQSEIVSLLGQEKGQQFTKYQSTLGERAQVSYFADQLDALNMPLSESQKEQLVGVLSEEKTAVPEPQPASWRERGAREAQLSWREDYYRRVFDRASGFLNAEQERRLREHQDLQMSVERQQMEAMERRRAQRRTEGG